MSLKKILAVVMACAMICGAFAASALTLDVAESANETVVAEEAALAAEEATVSVWDGVTVDTSWYTEAPTGTTEFTISSAAEFAGLAKLVNDKTTKFSGMTVKLAVDIDLNENDWTPIGSNETDTSFRGNFDGQGHTISNLSVSANDDYLGLFGYAGVGGDQGVVEFKNFTLHNATVVSTATNSHNGSYVAGIVANGRVITMTNVHLTGEIMIQGYGYVGGILGHGYPHMSNCSVVAEGSINCHYWCGGALVGYCGEGVKNAIVDSTVKGVGEGLNIWSAYGGIGAACGLLNDNSTMSSVAVDTVSITTNSNYCVGYVSGGNPSTDCIVSNVTAKVNGTEIIPDDASVTTKAVASVDGELYGDITEALAAIKDNSNVVIFEGEYDAALNISKANVTVKGVGEVTLNGEYTFKGKNFWVENIDFVCSKSDDYQIYYGTGTFKNCSFNGRNAFRSCYTDGEIVFDGCKIVGSTYGIHFDAGTGSVTVKNCELSGFNAFGYSLSHLTIENTKFYKDEASGYKHSNFWGNTTLKNCTFTPEITLATCAEDIIVTVDNCSVTDGSDVLDAFINGVNEEGALIIDGVVVSKAAKIGDVYFNTLEDAIAAAVADDIIIIYEGEYALPTTWKNDVTFKAADGATVVFNCQNKKPGLGGASVNFEGITFNWANADYFGLQHSGNLTYTNCTINGQPFLYGTSDTFNNCTFNQTSANAYNVWTYSSGLATFNKCTFNSAGKSVLIYNENGAETDATFNNCVFYASEAVEGKAAIEIDSSLFASGKEFDIVINNCSSTGFAKGSVSGDTLWNLKKGNDDTTDIVVNGIDVLKANYTVEVEFVKVDDATAEEYDLYRINIIGANDAVINRLNSGELTFNFVHDKPMSYEIVDIANDNITVTNVEGDKYEFHFEDKDGDDTKVENGTGSVITVAEVKFTGYGIYSFNVTDGVVHATKPADNIVDTYVPGGVTADGKKVGTFDIDDNTITNIEIVVPTRKLTVNVTFPNSVEEVYGDNQQMTVKVSGGDLAEALVYDLGSDVKMNDGAYAVVIEGKLTKNIAYNVEVSGAGYRTARYTVTMTDAKVLNFWNNVKDNDTVVEEGKYSEKKNFLAGDIVGDNNINIYDLSAVVSYFATSITDEADYETYVKYDLNRDHVIDSKDVAYVLVSWGE